MTRAREVLPGRSYMVTRRCTQRQLLLRPDPTTTQAFLYCLGVAAQRCHIELLWVLVMSNHHHTGIRDTEGQYPRFIEMLHGLVTKVLNVHRSRRESLWASSEKTSMVHLVDAEAALDKMVYALTNPVAAQLVARATEWPGASSLIAQLNSGSITVKRPKVYFPDDSTLPDEVTLRFVRPDGLEHLSDEDYKALLRDKIAAVEVMAASEREAKGTRVSGVAGVKNQSPFSYPKTSPPRRELSPRVACRNKWRRIEQLRRNKRFELAYREAFDALRAGVRDVLFPSGTWKLAQLGLVSCVPP